MAPPSRSMVRKAAVACHLANPAAGGAQPIGQCLQCRGRQGGAPMPSVTMPAVVVRRCLIRRPARRPP